MEQATSSELMDLVGRKTQQCSLVSVSPSSEIGNNDIILNVSIASITAQSCLIVDLASMDLSLETDFDKNDRISTKETYTLRGDRLVFTDQASPLPLQRALQDLSGTLAVRIVLSASWQYTATLIHSVISMLPLSTKCITIEFLSSLHDAYEEDNLEHCLITISSLPHLQVGLEVLVIEQLKKMTRFR